MGRGGKRDGVLTPGLFLPGHVCLGHRGQVPGRLQGGGTGWMWLGVRRLGAEILSVPAEPCKGREEVGQVGRREKERT